VALPLGAAAPRAGLVGALEAQVRQRRESRVRLEHDVAATAAVATIGPATRHELLTPEADGTISTRPGNYVYLYKIDHDLQEL
jgi:hypothetical protein